MIKQKYEYFENDLNDTRKVERKVVDALMSRINFRIKKDANEYKEPVVQKPKKIEEEDTKIER